MSHWCRGPWWPASWHSASWNWNCRTKLTKYLQAQGGREGDDRGLLPGAQLASTGQRLDHGLHWGRTENRAWLRREAHSNSRLWGVQGSIQGVQGQAWDVGGQRRGKKVRYTRTGGKT